MGDYSSGDEASLPGTSANLDHVYDATDRSNVGTNDTNYVDQTGSSGFEIHQYKDSITAGNASVTWIGKSSLAPSSSKVQLQVYKVAAPAGWQDVSGAGASNNVAAADTDFTLSGTIATADYLDSGVITWRVYQAASAAKVDFAPHLMGDYNVPTPYVISWSSELGAFTAIRAFNNQYNGGSDAEGYWLSDGQPTALAPQWIQVYLGSGNGESIGSYAIQVNNVPEPNRAPRDWTLLGSNTGVFGGEETTIDTQVDQGSWTQFEIRNFNVTTAGPFEYYRLRITDNNGDTSYCQVCELYLYNP